MGPNAKRLLFLGAPVFQIPIVKKAKEMGLFVGIVDISRDAPALPYADEVHICSIRDKDAVLQIAREFKPDGIVIGACDTSVVTGAFVCEALGLPGNSVEAAVNSTDKVKMIKAFARCGVAHPLFYEVKKDEIDSFSSSLPYPVISKPIDSAGGRGICIIHNSGERKEAMHFSSSAGYSGDILVEEYMRGKEVSVEVLVVDGIPYVIQITDKITSGEPHFFETGHAQPSTLPAETKKRIRELASEAVLAVGLKNSPAHVEIMLTEDGPKMVELGARLGGDCITTYLTDNSVSGVNMSQAAIEMALGMTPDVRHYADSGLCVGIRFIPAEEGVLSDIKGIEAAETTDELIALQITGRIGKHYSKAVDDSARFGYVVCSGKTTEAALSRCSDAIEKLHFVMERDERGN